MKNMALGNQLILGSFLFKSQVGFLKNILDFYEKDPKIN